MARSEQIQDYALHTFYVRNILKETTLRSSYAIFKPLWKTQVSSPWELCRLKAWGKYGASRICTVGNKMKHL